MSERKQKIMCFIGIALLLNCPVHADDLEAEYSRVYVLATKLGNMHDLKGLEALVDEIHNDWITKDKRWYGKLMVHVLAQWSTSSGTANVDIPPGLLKEHAQRALSTYDPEKSDNISVGSQLDLVANLYERALYSKGSLSDQEWADTRRQGTKAWLVAWQRLHGLIDVNWVPEDRPQGHALPPIGYPDIAPEAIADPVLRAEYEEAIETHREKTRIRNEQLGLRRLAKRYVRTIRRYLSHTYAIPPYASEELRDFLDTYVDDASVKEGFLNAVQSEIDADHPVAYFGE